jgi:hypothetical protein
MALLSGWVLDAPPSQAQAKPPGTVYDLTVRVLPEARRLEVSGTIRLPAADSVRAEIPLSLARPMSALRVEIVEPSRVAKLDRVDGGSDSTRVEGERGNARWILRPSRPIPAGEPISLRFSCAGGAGPGLLYHVGPEVAFASGWGDFWHPIPEGARQGTGELTVIVPAGWKAATGGVRRSSDDEEARGTFRSGMPQANYFTFVAGPYTVVRRSEGAVPLSAWLLSPRERIASWLAGADTLFQAVSAEFGPYPFAELGLVEVPREIAQRAGFHAFSPPGLLVLNHRAFNVPHIHHLLEWLGHEMGHQWFPHAISLDTPPGLFTEEALAEYGGLRAVETLAGPEAARRMRTQGYEYDPIYSAAAYFNLVGSGVDDTLAHLESGPAGRNLAYNKGSLVFDMLSREIGRTAFRRILHGMTRDRRFQTLTWREFLDEIENGAGRDLDWFYEQWFERTGAPDFQLTWSQEGDSLRGSVTQPAPHYRAPLTIEIRGHDGQQLEHRLTIAGARADFALRPGFRAASVVLDPGYEILRWTPAYRAAADSVRSKRGRR